MIISKAGTFKMLRILGIFCAIGMGFMTLVGTSEDDATDAAGIDDSFNESADIELDPVTTTETDISASVQPLANKCETLTINDAIKDLEDEGVIEDLDKVDISSVKLEYVGGTYSNVAWTPDTVASFTCSLTINGSQGEISVAETVVNGGSGNLSEILEQSDIDAINHYLANRNEEFTYCVKCDDATLDTYSVTYNVEIGVTIKGDIDVL